MKTLTFFQYSVLELIMSTKGGYSPNGMRSQKAVNELEAMGLADVREGKAKPIKNASYNYRGNTYIIS